MKLRIKNLRFSYAELAAFTVLALLLGASALAPNNAAEITYRSPEVTYAAYSPAGPASGAVIPASCESGYEHYPGECAPPNNPPTGFHDGNSGTVSSTDCRAFGWAYDPDGGNPIQVYVYVGGPAGSGAPAFATTANLSRPDVCAVIPGAPCSAGFDFQLPSQFWDNIARSIYAYGIDAQGGSNPLLQSSPKSLTCQPPPQNNASCLDISAPGTVTTGSNFSASVTMQNSGTKLWTSDATPHGLGSENPQNNLTWGLGRVGLPFEPVNSGQSATFNFTAIAPTTAGTYSFDWRMVEDGIEWFGATCQKNINVVVSLPGDFSLNSGAVACNSVPLSWTASANATGYRILRGAARVDISPYQPYTALNFTDTSVSPNTDYLYQIEAYNTAGTNRSNALNVNTPFCPPTLNFSGNPISIFQGQSSTLTWNTTYTTSCTASSAPTQSSWSGSKLLNGSQVVVPLPPPSVTYALTCTGPGGSIPKSVIINISPLALPEFREIIPR